MPVCLACALVKMHASVYSHRSEYVRVQQDSRGRCLSGGWGRAALNHSPTDTPHHRVSPAMCGCWERDRRGEGDRDPAVTGSQRESDKPLYKSASPHLGVSYACLCVCVCTRFTDKERETLNVLCPWMCVAVCVCVTDQCRWTTDKARHPGTIWVHIKTLTLPPTLAWFLHSHRPPHTHTHTISSTNQTQTYADRLRSYSSKEPCWVSKQHVHRVCVCVVMNHRWWHKHKYPSWVHWFETSHANLRVNAQEQWQQGTFINENYGI